MSSPAKMNGGQKLSQWLITSVCCAMGCMGGWLATASVVMSLPNGALGNGYDFAIRYTIVLASLLLAHVLIWKYAVPKPWSATDPDIPDTFLWNLLAAGANLWFVALVLFQVGCAFIILICVGLAFDDSPSSGLGF